MNTRIEKSKQETIVKFIRLAHSNQLNKLTPEEMEEMWYIPFICKFIVDKVEKYNVPLSPEEMQDLFQEGVCVALENPEISQETVEKILCRINELIDSISARKLHTEQIRALDEKFFGEEEDCADKAINSVLNDILTDLVRSLPEGEVVRYVYGLSDGERKTIKDFAKETGKTPQECYREFDKAMRILRCPTNREFIVDFLN